MYSPPYVKYHRYFAMDGNSDIITMSLCAICVDNVLSYAQTWLNLPTRLWSDILLGTCEKAKIRKLCISILFESLRICVMITYIRRSIVDMFKTNNIHDIYHIQY